MIKTYSVNVFPYLLLFGFLISNLLSAQSFNPSGLKSIQIDNPTSLDFGPNGKLYVAQQDGTIYEYTVLRDNAEAGEGTYTAIEAVKINAVKTGVPNHNDNGTINTLKVRQITGLLAAGTVNQPILYVSSSDSRIGGGGSGNDKNLDTNSGILSRLTWTGTTWDKVDLVRGLPRCEENHSTNGMEIFKKNGNTYLMLQQGGNANKGAPSNNFAGTPETFLSAAMLIINLTQLEQIEASNGGPFIDARYGNIKYVYDLPTLNDPNRPDIDNSSANFPYNVGHPMYNATIDLGDPFGGNNGLNQAFPEEGGPVQIFSTGWRNGYDVVITKEGRIYSVDNGPNTTWGGLPVIYDSNGQRKGDQGTTTYNPELGDYVTNDLNESGSDGHGDPLHYVGNVSDVNGSYYAGHPVPIRAFPSRAGLKVYEFDGEAWVIEEEYDFGNLLTGVSGYFNQVFDITDFPDNPIEGEYLSVSKYDARMRIFDIVNSSTNGMCEYTASNFDGAMKGDILTASFNGKINRYHLNESGDAVILKNNNFLSGFGSTPLDVIAQGDSDPFPGTIWAATYGADNITVFEPADFGNCLDPSDANYDGTADYDFDGYSNDDELANGTDICSGGSKPSDNDGDFISDLNDPDDDNDGIADVADPFAIDANNGLGTSLPIDYPFWNNDPGTGLFGLGFTGLMISGDGTTDYLTQYDDTNLSFGGAGGKATIDFVDDGSALDGNTQMNGFQFGVNVDSNSSPFTVHSKIETPFANVTSTTNLSYGIFIGNGDQDHYLQISIMDGSLADDGILGFKVVKEDGSPNVYSMVYDVNGLLGATSVDLYINVSPATNEAQPYYSLDGGESVIALGGKITLPVEVLDETDNQGMAVGLISTTGGGEPFTATWDYIRINIDGNANLVLSESPVDFGKLYTDASQVQLVETLKNEGGPSAGVVELSSINITGPDANLFSHDLELPLVLGPGANKTIPINFFPNGIEGIKSASLELVHDGDNSPYVVPLTAILEEYVEPAYTVVARVNAGGEGVLATDDQPDWESNIGNGAVTGITYTVNAGTIPGSTNTFQYENRHESVPDYIDEATFNAIYSKERYDPTSAPEMEFKFPVDNGNYVVNIYTGNGYGPANSVGARIFDISLESQLKGDDIDVVQLFGGSGTQFHAGMLSYDITVADGELNVLFEHTGTENPVLQAIEVLKVNGTNDPISIAQIENQLNFVDDTISLTVSASGGNQNENFTYAISGQPEGVDIEPTNGHIFGVIANGALSGGPNNNGDHQVTITVSKPGSSTENMVFQWSIGNYTWTDKEENESYTARHECSLVQSGDKFYLMGGRENAKTIDVYDYNTDSWKQITNSPPQEFNHFQAVEYKGLIWVIGAFKTNTFPQEQPAEYVWAFDPVTEKWIQGAEIPESRRRGSTGLVVYNDKFYISGGNTVGHDGGYVSWLDQYDPSTGQWTVLSDAPRARDHFHAAVIGHKMYLAGGRLSGGQGGVFAPTIEEVDVYDFSQGEWSTLPSQQNIPTPRAAPVTASINGKLIVAGGEVQNQNVYGTVVSGALKITEQYDPETGSWSRLPDLNHHRHGTQAIVSGNGVFVMGGSPNLGGGNQKNMEFFGEDTPTGTANTASQISAPTLVDMNPGESAAIDLQAIDGNMGVYIRSVTLKGDEGGYFTLSTANVENILLEPNGTLELNVTLSETGANKNAILSIEYATEATLDIVLKNGEYNSGIANPGTQYNRVGEAVSLQIETENMGNNLNFSAVGLPPGLQIDEDNGLISGTITTTGSDGPFLENNGLVVIEAESGDLVPGWTATNVGGATGIKASTNSFNSQNGGTIPYEIKVTTPGVYRFNWRSFYSGENSTEENDNWLKFPNNDDVWFFGYKGAITDEAALINNLQGPQENIVFPKGSSRVSSQTTPEGGGSNGFFKIWRSGGNPEVYDWQARTSDNDSHNVYVWFVNPGTYTMQVSERSAGHAIDKMALYKIDGTNYSDILLTNASESKRDGIAGSVEENSPYNVTVTVNNNSNTSSTEFNWIIGNSGNPVAILSANKTTGRAPLAVNFTGSQSSDDVAIVDYSWEFGDELSSTSEDADPTFNFLKAGTYTVLLRVRDGDNNIDTKTIEINVLPTMEHTIAVSVGQNGSVSPNGNVQVVEGNDQEFTISPNSGYTIKEVIVDGVSQGAVENYIFYNVTGDHSLEATFIKKPISIEATAGLGGEISPKGTINIPEGGNQKFTAIAAEGYEFDYFIVDNSFTVSEPEYLFENVSGEHIIKAVFVEKEKPKYLITSSAGFGGFISPVGDNWVEESGSIVFSVTESDGYQFEHFLVDGIVVADMAEYTFENVMEVHSIEAVFKSIQGDYTLNLLASEGGTLDPSGTLYVKEGDTQEVNIIPNEGYQIKQILVDGVEVTIVESYKFENISSSHEMQVVFQKTNEGPSALIRADVKSGYSPLLVNFDGSNSSDDVAITSFTWNFGDGSNTIEGETAAHTYNSVGIYTATLTVEDIEGEISTETIEITVLDSPGLSEEGNKELRIYPNPASSEVSLGLVKGANLILETVSVFDMSGNLVLESDVKNTAVGEVYKVTVANLSDGLYYVRTKDVSGNEMIKRLLVKH